MPQKPTGASELACIWEGKIVSPSWDGSETLFGSNAEAQAQNGSTAWQDGVGVRAEYKLGTRPAPPLTTVHTGVSGLI